MAVLSDLVGLLHWQMGTSDFVTFISHEHSIILCTYFMMSFDNPASMHYLAELSVFVFLHAMCIAFSGESV